jgi:hypothetical protein
MTESSREGDPDSVRLVTIVPFGGVVSAFGSSICAFWGPGLGALRYGGEPLKKISFFLGIVLEVGPTVGV